MKILDLLEELKYNELELRCLDYGSIEIRKKHNKEYIYGHYKYAGFNVTKYLGEYSIELYNHLVENNEIAKKIKKEIRRVKRMILKEGYKCNNLTEKVKLNIDYTRKHLPIIIHNQAILEGINISYLETENILQESKVNNMLVPDVIKILDLERAWNFILNEYIISAKTDFNILCIINKLVLDFFYTIGGKVRTSPVTISGTSWVPDFPIEADIKDNINNIINKKKTDIDKAIELLLYVSRKQMFLDGNKRCAVIFANHYLISKGKGLIVIPDTKVSEYKELLVKYYETNNSKEISAFLKKECITKI